MDAIAAADLLAQAVRAAGGTAYAVGGWVRDQILGKPSADLDLEIHGIDENTLWDILSSIGKPLSMGKSFGIYSLTGTGMDISLPRNQAGDICPLMGPEAAARRRDFTCNAMMQDWLTGEILDFFGGTEDLKKGILRHTDLSNFQEDPLRVLRCARLAAVYGFTVAPETMALGKTAYLSGLPRERAFGELERALLESPAPSVFFTVLGQMDQLDVWFPEVRDLIGVPQPPRYHGEGDVWNHTMLVLDQAAKLKNNADNPLGFLLSALCHDFGKVLTTTVTETGIHAYGHEAAGLPLVGNFLSRLTARKDLIPYVQNLTQLHMRPNALAAQNASKKAYYKMLDLALDPKALLCLAAADDLGRITEAPRLSPKDIFTLRYQEFEALRSMPQVTGEDLIRAGISPGKNFSSSLAYAHKLHLSGVSKEAALKQTLSYIRKNP